MSCCGYSARVEDCRAAVILVQKRDPAPGEFVGFVASDNTGILGSFFQVNSYFPNMFSIVETGKF